MPKTNDEILTDYKTEFTGLMQRYFLPALQGGKPPEPSHSDAMLMLELYHIMQEYKRDPFKSLLLTKLAYDADDYKGQWNMEELATNLAVMTKWWAAWKPNALFV